MANWMTVDEISARYVVGEQRLLAYAMRGNLGMRRLPGGTTLFDETAVALFFRPRSAAAAPPSARMAANLGVLGTVRLGEWPAPDDEERTSAPLPTLGPREVRARALRRSGAPAFVPPEKKRAAG